MKMLQCIIADDEPIARQVLETYIKDLPNLELVASCKNAFEVMEVVSQKNVDVLFLDINMPKLSGLSLLKTMQQKPSVIITTAYSEYAVEGFELSVTDYLLKPFSFERFMQAVMKVEPQKEYIKSVEIEKEDNSQTSIFVKSDKKLVKLNFNEISHIEAYGNYIKIYTSTMTLTSQTLSDFLMKLPPSFMRVHKSFAINFNKIELLDGNQLVLENKVKVTVGKSYRKELLDRIEKEIE